MFPTSGTSCRLLWGICRSSDGFIDDILELKPLPKMLGIVIGAVIVWALQTSDLIALRFHLVVPMIHFGPVLTFDFNGVMDCGHHQCH